MSRVHGADCDCGRRSAGLRALNLNTNGIERIYTIWGKTNLTDGTDWECPTNAAHRFFKVKVELP